MHGKAIRWGGSHTGKYIYHRDSKTWVNFCCSLDHDLACTAPMCIKSSDMSNYEPYSFRLTKNDEYLAERMLAGYANILEAENGTCTNINRR